MRALGEAGVRLVEADVAVVADAQQLQVGVAGLLDDAVVLGARGLGVGVGAVRHMGVCLVDVDVIEQVLLHEVVVALGVIVGQATVLVQVVGAHLGEVQVAGLVGLDEVLIGANGRGAGGETQNAAGIHDDLGGDEIRCLAAHVLIVGGMNDTHNALLSSGTGIPAMRPRRPRPT